ncbi:MAG: LPS export ABC transporter periplasmic protein LptC [Polaromonas sp.]|nr:LPS export ABC transporter periplasmic protein LptC [Polaromonas sp.]
MKRRLPKGIFPGWLRDGWESLTLYLPMLLMGMLALGTYWLIRNTAPPHAASATAPVSREADYFMRNFSVKNFDANGRLKSEIFGREGRHFPSTDILEIDDARIRSFTPAGRLTTATGRRAYSNGDGSEVQLVGNALVVREADTEPGGRVFPRLEFRGEFLHAFLNEERVTSNKPVILTRGTDQFTGNEFAYSKLDQVVELKGRVRGVLNPRAGTPANAPLGEKVDAGGR